MAKGNKREITWCFMPSQPVRITSGRGESERSTIYKKEISKKEEKRAVMQTNAGEWLARQRSAARRELKTEAS